MKGIVFKELLGMAEEVAGEEVVEQVIEESDLPSGGAYTSVGTYDHTEVLSIVSGLSGKLKLPINSLVVSFGEHLVKVFLKRYPRFFDHEEVFSFLESIDSYIHVEVRKLYPDAELPKFTTSRDGDGVLVMKYESRRPFAKLAEGLIRGSIRHFGNGEELEVDIEPEYSGKKATFRIIKR